MYKKGESVGETFIEFCQQIDEYNDQIEIINRKNLESKGLLKCVKCGNKIKSDAKFCPECGAEQVKNETIIDE